MMNSFNSINRLWAVVLTCCLSFSPLLATHVLTYDGYASCISKDSANSTLEIHLVLYCDKTSPVSNDASMDVAIYLRSNEQRTNVVTANRISQNPVFENHPNWGVVSRVEYKAVVTLPRTNKGYTLLTSRCCLHVTDNFLDDQGFDLRIEVPDAINPGENTGHFTRPPIFYINRNLSFSIDIPVEGSLYDSVHYISSGFYSAGSDSDPIPSLPTSLPAKEFALMKTGFTINSPLGSSGTHFYKQPGNTMEIAMSAPGRFLLPYNACYFVNGDSFIYNRSFFIHSLPYTPTPLHLGYISSSPDSIVLSSVVDLQHSGQVILQRSEDSTMGNPVVVPITVPADITFRLTDKTVEKDKIYYYRLKSDGTPNVYSNTVKASTIYTPVSTFTKSQLKVYPNPATGSLYIVAEHNTYMQIFQATGTEVWSGSIAAGEQSIDISKLAAGIYFMRESSGAYLRLRVE